MTDPDTTRLAALTAAVDLARSSEPILPAAVPDVALAALEIAVVFEEYLRREDPT